MLQRVSYLEMEGVGGDAGGIDVGEVDGAQILWGRITGLVGGVGESDVGPACGTGGRAVATARCRRALNLLM